MADTTDDTRGRWAQWRASLADRTEPTRKELVEAVGEAYQSFDDWYKTQWAAWNEWRERRAEPAHPVDRLRRHWPSLVDDDAPLHALRERMSSSNADLRRVDDAVRRVRRTRDKVDRIRNGGVLVGFVLVIGGGGALLGATNIWMEPGLGKGEAHGVAIAVAVWFGLAFVLDALISLFGRQHAGTTAAFGLAVITAAAAAVLTQGTQGYGEFVVLGGAAAFNWSLLSFAAAEIVAERYVASVRYRSMELDPSAHVLVSLGDVADGIGRQDEDVIDRRTCVVRLDEAAVAIEDHLASELVRYSDHRSGRRWIVGQLRRRAAGLRMLQRPLYLPRSGEDVEVAELCGELSVVVLDGRWGDLPEVDVEPVEATNSVLAVVRSLLVAAIPLGVVASADWFSDSFGGAAASWAWMGAVGWCVVLLLLVLDPRLGEKLDLVGHLVPWLSRGGTSRQDEPRSIP